MTVTTVPGIDVTADYVLPDGVPSATIFVRCGCRVEPQPIPLHVLAEAITWLRRFPIPGDLPILSHRCRHCKQTVAITARMLYLAA